MQNHYGVMRQVQINFGLSDCWVQTKKIDFTFSWSLVSVCILDSV